MYGVYASSLLLLATNPQFEFAVRSELYFYQD